MQNRNKSLGAALRAALAPPPPAGKRAFVRRYAARHTGLGALLWQQAGYLRPRTWLVSLLVLAAGLWASGYTGQVTLWQLGALTPFLAMTVVTESTRAQVYGMVELEMTATLPRKSMVLARLCLLGLLHSALLCALCALTPAWQTLWGRSLTYLLLPYLITAVLGLAVTRRLPGPSSAYPCLAVATAVAAAGGLLPLLARGLYSAARFRWWPPALLILTAAFGWELRQSLNQMEELPCN